MGSGSESGTAFGDDELVRGSRGSGDVSNVGGNNIIIAGGARGRRVSIGDAGRSWSVQGRYVGRQGEYDGWGRVVYFAAWHNFRAMLPSKFISESWWMVEEARSYECVS